MSKGLLEPTFKKFFSNYDEKNFDFSLFKGDLKLSNMYFDNKNINEILDNSMVPFKIKFGMITKLHIKISIIGLYIEFVDIEDLIVVLAPDPTKSMRFSQKSLNDPTLKESVIKHMIENFKALISKSPLKPFTNIDQIPKEVVTSLKERKEEAEVPFKERGKQNFKKNSLNQFIEDPKANLMGPEFFEIITGRLKFNIRIKNIRIYYEDDQTLTFESTGKKSCFSFCFNITEMRLNTQEILDYCDQKGNFKDLFNIKNLMDTLSPTTKLIYLNKFIQRASLEVYLGQINILPSTVDSDMKSMDPSYFVDYFHRLNSRRRGVLIELFAIDSLNFDIILGHDQTDTTSLPIQGLILYIHLKDIVLNLQIGVLSEITSIMNFVSSIKALNEVSSMRPDLTVMTSSYMSKLSSNLKFDRSQIDLLKKINREIIRESFAIPMWRDLFLKYGPIDNIDVKRRMIYRYRLSSLIYQLIHGENYEQIESDERDFIRKETEYLDAMAEIAQSQALNKGVPSQDLLVNASNVEEPRVRVDRQLSKISKTSWKFHVQVRLHTNLYVNMLDQNLKKELAVVLKGLDLNIVKPRGRLHINIGIMLKHLLVSFNQQASARPVKRSIFDSAPQVNGEEAARQIHNREGTSLNSELKSLVEAACIDFKKFKINIDITTEEHISKYLIPIVTITVELFHNRETQVNSSCAWE